MSPLKRRFSSRNHQRGAIGLIAAGTLSMALLCMLVVLDSGRLYLEKRSLQRVADVSALEVASRKGTCAAGTAIAYATQSAARNGFTIGDDGRTLTTTCGKLTVGADSRRVFGADPTQSSAIQVAVTHSVPRSIAAGIGAMFDSTPQPLNIQLSAVAVAAATPPLASLTIRSTLLSVDTQKSAILNSLFSGLLGGNVSIDAVGWNGLINTNINLLSYLDQLKLNLNLSAVGYDQVLGTNIAVSDLIKAAVDVLNLSGTAGVNVAVGALQVVQGAVGTTTVILGNLLQVKGGTETAGLTTNLQVFQLLEGFVQLANKQNGLVANQTIDLGLVKLTAKIQVLEPAQLSAIGNPILAAQNPLGPDRIYVQTAQTRALLSVDLPILSALSPLISGLTNAVSNLVGPLSNTLNSLLNLDLVGVLSSAACLLGAGCDIPSIELLGMSSDPSAPTQSPRVDVSLELGKGESHVTGYSCVSNTNKTLTTSTTTALVQVKIGQIDPATVFPASPSSPNPTVAVAPLKILDIGVKTCHTFLIFPTTCGPRTPSVGGGIGISVDAPLGTNATSPNGPVPTTTLYSSSDPQPLKDIGQAPEYKSISAGDIVGGLSNTIKGINVNVYQPAPANKNLLGNIIGGLGTILTGVTTAISNLLQNALSPILDPLINTLLASLGIDLNKVDVGANLSCNLGQATLVI